MELYDRGDILMFDAGSVSMTFSKTNGAWISCSMNGACVLAGDSGLSPITLNINGVPILHSTNHHMVRDAIPIGKQLKFTGYHTTQIPLPTLSMVFEGADWRVEELFTYNLEKARVERSFHLCYLGDDEVLLRDMVTRMPPVANESQCVLELPGCSNILHQRCDELPYGRFKTLNDYPGTWDNAWHTGVLGTIHPERQMTSWLYGEELISLWDVYHCDQGTWFEQIWLCAARMQKGDSLDVGTQYFFISEEPFADTLPAMQVFWDEIGVRLKQPTPDWARDAAIYEAVIGQKTFHKSNHVYSPYPEIQDLIRDLPRIKKLGFTALEVMPRFPFPNYSVHNYFDIDTHYGPMDDMKALIREAHTLGMRVLLDVVMHGVADKTVSDNAIYRYHPLLLRHPEFFMYSEDGQVVKTYTWAFDQANEAFREYMKKVFCYYVRILDVDGFRVDAIHWNSFPNWAHNLPYPAYRSIASAFGMFAGVRDAVWEIKPGIVFYSETQEPMMANSYDIFYNYDEMWLYECLMPPLDARLPLPDSARMPNRSLPDARGAAEWLDMRRSALPRGFIKVRHADSHDTHERMWIGIFRRDYLGLAQSRALFAYCCFVDGAIMNFVGGETGSEEEYKVLIEKRGLFKALARGSCDYLAITSKDRRLFAPLRVMDEQVMLPVINFSTESADAQLDLHAIHLDEDADYLLTEHMRGVTISGKGVDFAMLPVRLAPYEYQLWQIEKKGGR